jgi:hypothetical protein
MWKNIRLSRQVEKILENNSMGVFSRGGISRMRRAATKRNSRKAIRIRGFIEKARRPIFQTMKDGPR